MADLRSFTVYPGDVWIEIGNDRAKIERLIAAALKTAIDAHGPITLENRASASKRIYGTLKARAKGDA